MEVVQTVNEMFLQAKALEQSGELEAAADIYNRIITADKLNEAAYDRLMIIYRKLKDAKKEQWTIDAGIKAYRHFYKQKRPHSRNKKIKELSQALMKSTGLTDKKGNSVFIPEPIARWQKRKTLLEKKAGK